MTIPRFLTLQTERSARNPQVLKVFLRKNSGNQTKQTSKYLEIGYMQTGDQ